MRVDKTQWRSLTLGLLENKKFIELAMLHVDKQAVARHQLARDWHWKDAFLYTLERESVTGGDVVILVGRTNESKTNHFQRAEHFAFFRHKDVMSCAWGWIVELQLKKSNQPQRRTVQPQRRTLQARGLYSEIAGKTWQKPEVSKRELFYKEKVLGNPTYGKMYKALDEQMKSSGIISKFYGSETAISEMDYIRVMRHQQSMLFQDMAEKMDNAEYMTAVGENNPFLNCFLFDNDAFKAYRESARQSRASFGINDSHHAQIERAVPLVATAIRQSQHEGVQQRTAIMEGVLDANEKLDSLSTEVRSNNAAILRLDCHMAAVSQEKHLIRDEYLVTFFLYLICHTNGFLSKGFTFCGGNYKKGMR
ncbi:hypothetical protein BDR26DRAFT_952534 [Obelidium mucronatum]|nr:hypothetical protein BDR26DRAFT_952534 [Obelidium mucronatum]